jgi:prepilin-type N-terminal cleavage/methylation domain-containing protein
MLTRRRSIALRPRHGVSLLEIIVAMTLLAVVVGSLSVLSAKSIRRGKDLDLGSARTFVLMQQANRFSVLPYDSISLYEKNIDSVITVGRFTYLRHVSCTKDTATVSTNPSYFQDIPCANTNTSADFEYKTMKVVLQEVSDTTHHRDSLLFVRARVTQHNPLFVQ